MQELDDVCELSALGHAAVARIGDICRLYASSVRHKELLQILREKELSLTRATDAEFTASQPKRQGQQV